MSWFHFYSNIHWACLLLQSSGSPKMDHSLVDKSDAGVQLDLGDDGCLPEAGQRSPELDLKCLQDPLESSRFSAGILKRRDQNICPTHPFSASCEQLDPFPNPCSHDNGNRVLSPQKPLLMGPGGT